MDLASVVKKAASGDHEAFADLMKVYQQRTFGYAYVLLGDAHLAQDVVQQTFLAAFNSLNRLDDPDRFPGWLRTITRHECQRILRKRWLATISLEAARIDIASTTPVDELVEWREAVDHVLTAVDSLPPLTREVAVLYYLHDCSQREVATRLELPITTVNNRLHAARQLMRTSLDITRTTHFPPQYPATLLTSAGRIVSELGVFVDVRYPVGQSVPSIFDCIQVDGYQELMVAQHPEPTIARCVALPSRRRSRSHAPTSSEQIESNAVDLNLVNDIIGTLAVQSDKGTNELLETGISAIDLLCPFPRRGVVALAGEPGIGKIVLLQELIRRLSHRGTELTIVVLVRATDEVSFLSDLAHRGAGIFPSARSIQVVYVPVSDEDGCIAQHACRFDSLVVLSRDLARRGIYPAVDPVRSTSRLLNNGVGDEHVAVARAFKEIVGSMQASPATAREKPSLDQRDDRLMRTIVSQPMYVAEGWTGIPGQFRSCQDTIRLVRGTLDSNRDELHAINSSVQIL